MKRPAEAALELTPAERRALEAFRAGFAAEFGTIRRLAVFGSRARGTFDQDSDVDLLVLVDGEPDWRMRYRTSKIALEAGLREGVLLSPKVFSFSRWARQAREPFSFAAEVEAEAVDL